MGFIIDPYRFASAPTTETLGTWGQSPVSGRAYGAGVTGDNANAGFKFQPSVSNGVLSVKYDVTAVGTAGNHHAELWSDNAGNPGSQIGSDSDTVNVNSTGDKTFTFSTPPAVTAGTNYWIVFVGGGNITVETVANQGGNFASGRDDSIAQLADDQLTNSEDWRVEIEIG